jgi:hypothetical protein
MKLRPFIALIMGVVLGLSLTYIDNHHNKYPSVVMAQVQSADPCATTSIAKIGIPINIGSATTTSLIAPGVSANSIANVCGLSLTITGASSTFQLEYGTGATCGTGTTAMTGAYAGASTPVAVFTGTGALVVAAPAANRVCAVTTGTVSAQGVLTYVLQPL